FSFAPPIFLIRRHHSRLYSYIKFIAKGRVCNHLFGREEKGRGKREEGRGRAWRCYSESFRTSMRPSRIGSRTFETRSSASTSLLKWYRACVLSSFSSLSSLPLHKPLSARINPPGRRRSNVRL